jgi:hypothetical protein
MKRRSFTVNQKLSALEELRRNDGNIDLTSRITGIARKNLREWRKNEEKLIKQKKTARSSGSGRRPFWPLLEAEMVEWLFFERNERKSIITYNSIREKAIQIAEKFNYENFIATDGWIKKFLNRNGLSCRKITSVGQEDNRSQFEIRQTVLEYFSSLREKISNLSPSDYVLNMDETPIYVDMMRNHTISFKGEKNTEVNSTGNQKTRLTVVLTISSAGEMLKAFVILRGLKKVPKCEIPRNVVVGVSKSGSMDQKLMKDWAQSCLNRNGPFNDSGKKLLLLDSFKSHHTEDVLNFLSSKNTQVHVIPPRTTSFLQPLDVLIFAIFKANMKSKWDQ